MSDYNANGGQRRSSKTRFDFPVPKHQCKLCGVKKANLVEADGWEMQHLHLNADNDHDVVKFLTCDKCKNRSPFEFLKKIQESERKDG